MNIRSVISQNKWKSYLIMVLFVVFISTLAYVFAKATGASAVGYGGIALVLAGISSIGSYFFSDKMVIATTGARKVTKEEYPEYYRIVENLCIADGLPMPQVYVLDDPAPNAFATGRDPKHGVVCATTGILQLLNKSELEGVIAHELSHIKNFDTRLMAIVAILVGFIAIFADIFMRSMWFGGMNRDNDNDSRSNAIFLIVGIVLAILSPIAATLIQLAVSRKREFLADASGALLTRYPEGLASALEKLAADNQPVRTATNATAHLFIENPFNRKDTGAWFSSLFNTHPPMEERIKILRSM
jgi:heat shock protein HtpX